MKKQTHLALYISIFSILLTFLLFYSARHAGMVHDFTGFYLKMKSGSFEDAFRSFDYNVVQPALQVFNFLLYAFAGRNAMVYFLVYLLIYGLGIFSWSRFLLAFTKSTPTTVTIIALFLVSPYTVEVLTYDVCQAYLITFVLLGTYCHSLLRYLKNAKRRHFAILAVCLLIQLWTFDLILVYFPLTIFLFVNLRKLSIPVALTTLSATACYFLQNTLILGSWVGHYGSDVHMALDVKQQLGTIIKYHVKQLGLSQFYPYPLRTQVYEFVSSWGFIAFFCLMSMFAVLKTRFRGPAIFFFVSGLISLIPVSNLTFLTVMTSENDRYGFLFAFFMAATLAYILLHIKRKWVGYTLLAALFLTQFWAQRQLILYWSTSQEIVDAVLDWPDEFYEEEKQLLLLNLPDNYRGIYLFKKLGEASPLMEETYYSQKEQTDHASFQVVAQMNMYNLMNGASVELHEGKLRVSLDQYGTWWWRNSNGAGSYETELFKMELHDLLYDLTLKSDDLACYYWDELDWHKVDDGRIGSK